MSTSKSLTHISIIFDPKMIDEQEYCTKKKKTSKKINVVKRGKS